MKFRRVTNEDSEGVISLIDSIYREYGDRVCLEGADKDLTDLAAHYDDGRFMVLEDDAGKILGTVALTIRNEEPGCCYMRRLYLHPDLRGGGQGQRLVEWVLTAARRSGATRIEFWSDTRFSRAHSFYGKLGFQHDGTTRTMNDGWEPYDEFFYHLDL